MELKVIHVFKSFKKDLVLRDINFSIKHGEIAGFVGPNGSGKTTLLNLIMGLLSPDSGTISYNELIGAAVSRKGFFEGMTVEDNLLVLAELKQQPQVEVKRVMGLFNIDFGNVRFGRLSAGMKQRVALAQAFMGDYRLILLDEPTNHLDIDSIFNLRSAIEARKNEGTAFILTSHVLTEMEKLCDRALFLFEGSLIKEVKSTDPAFANLEDEYMKLSKR